MKYANHFGLILLMFILGLSAYAKDTQIQIIEPKDMSIHTHDSVSVVISVDPKLCDAIVITNRNKRYAVMIKENKKVYCKTVPINSGENRIRIKIFNKDEIIKEERREIYYATARTKAKKFFPDEYKEKFFHTDKQEELCKQCHDMSVNEVEGVKFKQREDSNCYICHSSMMDKKKQHAPSVNWVCTSCHNGTVAKINSTDVGKSKYLAPNPIREVCLDCHKEVKEELEDNRYQHYPFAFGSCNRCHDSHATQNNFVLRNPAWDLCKTCHKYKADKDDFLKEYRMLEKHPLDPIKTGKEFSCVSCHHPHVSNEGFLLREGYDDDRKICERLNLK